MVKRNTTIRDRHRAAIAKGQPPCALCGEPIDYAAKYPAPLSFVVDHIIPIDLGGTDVLANKQAAHRGCNSEKSNRLHGAKMRRTPGLIR